MSDDNELENRADSTTPSDPGHEEPRTQREVKRKKEDKEYVPVIVKRTDESLRHPDDILEKAIAEGLEQLQRPFFSLLLSAMAAGLILGFTAMSVAIIISQAMNLEDISPQRLAGALVYPLGFVLCIMSGSQLFTEHTATAVYPILDRRGRVASLMRLWSVVILGNLIGALVSAHFLVAADGVVKAAAGYVAIGHHLVTFGNGPLFVSSVLAGWLMALGAWLVMGTPPALSQMVAVYIVTFIIGLGGLHHSIAGSVEMFTAYLISNEFAITEVVRFIGMTILGNLIGGSIFVALLNYGHIRETQRTPDEGE